MQTPERKDHGAAATAEVAERFVTLELFGDWKRGPCPECGAEGAFCVYPAGAWGCEACDAGGQHAADLERVMSTALAIEDIRASKVTTKPVEWLWKGRIPKGKLTIFDGDPDLGKSVVTVDIAARNSTGRAFPDGAPCKAGNVLIVNVEDGVADTIVPRLKAHGADLARVFIFSSVPDGKGGTRLLDLPEDLALLEKKVRQRRADLLIIDPVLTMLGGDANKDQDARKALTPLRDMAERTECAVVAVRHLNKSVGLKAIQRGGGNMGLIGVARAGSFFAEHPDDEGLRIMAPHKSNLAEKPPSLSYHIVTSAVHKTARVEWMGATNHDANSLAAGAASPQEKSVLDDAKEFLRNELGEGPVMAHQVFKDARQAGVAEITLRRAKSALGVKSERQGTEGWAWRLPHEGDHRPPGGGGGAEPQGTAHECAKDDQTLAYDRNDQDDHVGHLGNGHRGASEYFPYVKEDDHGDQEDHDDHRGRDDHDHDRLPVDNRPLSADLFPGESATFEELRRRREERAAKVVEVLDNPEYFPGPALVLAEYRSGNAPLDQLTCSILAALKVDFEECERYRPLVKEALQREEPT